MLDNCPSEQIKAFVNNLWTYTEQRSLGLAHRKEDAKKVRESLQDIDVSRWQDEIADELSGHILLSAVKVDRQRGLSCAISACEARGHVFCGLHSDDNAVHQFGRSIILETICRLDGVFGLDYQQMASIVVHYWSHSKD